MPDWLIEQVGDPFPGVFGGAFNCRFGHAHAAHLLQQVGTALETIADATGQTGELFDGRSEVARGDARVGIEGTAALATAAAVVVGSVEAKSAEEADQGAPPVLVVGGGLFALGAGHAGTFVAVFFDRGGTGRPWRRLGG